MSSDLETVQLNRNLDGIAFEKLGKTHEAILLYEANIREGFDGSHPYDRLAIIYDKRKDYVNEIRVLEKAITVFKKLHRADATIKLARYIKRLEDARMKEEKHKLL